MAALLDKLHVRDFTKSRPLRSTGNALVEGKNANVERRFLGHDHIPQRFAPLVDTFAQEHLSPYLNHHRPCLFATERAITRVCALTDTSISSDVSEPFATYGFPQSEQTRSSAAAATRW